MDHALGIFDSVRMVILVRVDLNRPLIEIILHIKIHILGFGLE